VAYEWRLLEEILTIKDLTKEPTVPGQPPRFDNARIIRLTNIPASDLCRYLQGREPMSAALTRIADGLELDLNFLLGDRRRFGRMDLPHALAHMALDRYVNDNDLDVDDVSQLRAIADAHPDLPMWSRVWKQIHESLMLTRQPESGRPTRESTRPYPPRRVRRRETRNV
jgi:hypothetical protein